ncbi:MAG: hypothetical protein IJO65_05770 [Lachnospiraceae bacterium]|nr:hypothetical protein [Lachnospiraceae bacterium]
MEHKFVGNRTSNTYFNWFSIIGIDVPDIIVRIIGIIDLLALSVLVYTTVKKEDFMWQLFGIDTTPQDTIDYWDK